jgi:hypothetical protein
MLSWILLSGGVALGVLALACALAMVRAERRARRHLYTALGLHDELVSVLMGQKGPVSTQLAVVRQSPVASGVRPEELRSRVDGQQPKAQRSFRFTRALNAPRTIGDERPALAPARRSRRFNGRDPS